MEPLGVNGYNMLDLGDRLQVLWKLGVSIGNVKTETLGYSLYSLFGFYVEVELRYEADNTVITAATPFVYGDRLEKYEAGINLPEWIHNR